MQLNSINRLLISRPHVPLHAFVIQSFNIGLIVEHCLYGFTFTVYAVGFLGPFINALIDLSISHRFQLIDFVRAIVQGLSFLFLKIFQYLLFTRLTDFFLKFTGCSRKFLAKMMYKTLKRLIEDYFTVKNVGKLS